MPSINPVSTIDNEEDRDANVGGEETARGPVLRPEDVEAVDEREQDEHDHGQPGTPGLEPFVVVGKVGVGDALGAEGFAEAEVDYAAADPGYEG